MLIVQEVGLLGLDFHIVMEYVFVVWREVSYFFVDCGHPQSSVRVNIFDIPWCIHNIIRSTVFALYIRFIGTPLNVRTIWPHRFQYLIVRRFIAYKLLLTEGFFYPLLNISVYILCSFPHVLS